MVYMVRNMVRLGLMQSMFGKKLYIVCWSIGTAIIYGDADTSVWYMIFCSTSHVAIFHIAHFSQGP